MKQVKVRQHSRRTKNGKVAQVDQHARLIKASYRRVLEDGTVIKTRKVGHSWVTETIGKRRTLEDGSVIETVIRRNPDGSTTRITNTIYAGKPAKPTRVNRGQARRVKRKPPKSLSPKAKPYSKPAYKNPKNAHERRHNHVLKLREMMPWKKY